MSAWVRRLIVAITLMLSMVSPAGAKIDHYKTYMDVDGDYLLVCKDNDAWTVYYHPAGQVWDYGLGYDIDDILEAHGLYKVTGKSANRENRQSCP